MIEDNLVEVKNMIVAHYTKKLTLVLPPEIYKKIEELSDARQISKGQYVREILARGMDKNDKKEITNNG
jgi:hypothetical protein